MGGRKRAREQDDRIDKLYYIQQKEEQRNTRRGRTEGGEKNSWVEIICFLFFFFLISPKRILEKLNHREAWRCLESTH